MQSLISTLVPSGALLLTDAACGARGERNTVPVVERVARSELPSRPAAPRHLALLVGINDYAHPAFPDLAGAIGDAETFRDILQVHYGFAEAEILFLRDREATHDGLVRAFEEHLIARADANTVAVFYFSGHGSRKSDVDGDEADALDETLVAHDSGREGSQPNNDLSDDELGVFLARLSERTGHTTVVLDACYSATGVRGLGKKSVQPDLREAHSARPGDARDNAPAANLRYTLISAAASDELAYEREFEGRTSGALTYYLSQALRAAAGDATFRDVMERVQSEVSGQFPQHPQLEGDGQDDLVFGVSARPRLPYVPVTRDGEQLVLGAGRVHGVSDDSLYALYPEDVHEFVPSLELARVKVARAGDFTSQLAFVSAAPTPPLVRARAVEFEHAHVVRPLRIFFEAASERSGAQEARELLRRAVDVREVTTEGQADAIVVATARDGVRLTTDKARPLSPEFLASPEQGRKLADAILAWTRWLRLHSLANRSVPTTGLQLEFPRTKGGLFDQGQISGWVRAGQPHLITVHNRTESPWFFYVLALSGDGSASVLFPPFGAHERLAPQTSWSQALSTCVPEGWHDPLYDTIKVVFTQQEADFSFVRQQPIVRGELSPQARSANDRVTELVVTRGLTVKLDPRTWVAVQKTVEILPEPSAPPCR